MTKITGLKTIASKLESLNIPESPVSPHSPNLKNCIRIRKGDPIINIHNNPILIRFAIKSKSNQTEKINNQKNLKRNQRVNVLISGESIAPR